MARTFFKIDYCMLKRHLNYQSHLDPPNTDTKYQIQNLSKSIASSISFSILPRTKTFTSSTTYIYSTDKHQQRPFHPCVQYPHYTPLTLNYNVSNAVKPFSFVNLVKAESSVITFTGSFLPVIYSTPK